MRSPVVLFLLAVAAGVGVIVISIAGESSPMIGLIAAGGAIVSLAGGAYGRPQLVCAGAVAMLGGFGFTLSTGSSDAVDSLLVALLMWLVVELQLRSIELRRAVVPSASATTSWVGVVVGVAAGTVLFWLVIGAIEAGAPDGGLVYRVLAVAAVVVVAVMVSGVSWRRQESGVPGSGGSRQ